MYQMGSCMTMHIVHVEDDPSLRNILKTALMSAEPTIQLYQSETVEEAFEYVEEQGSSVDLYLINIQVSGNPKGMLLAHHIRLRKFPGSILLTSADGAPSAATLNALQCEYVPKPWNLLSLIGRISRHQPSSKKPTLKFAPSANADGKPLASEPPRNLALARTNSATKNADGSQPTLEVAKVAGIPKQAIVLWIGDQQLVLPQTRSVVLGRVGRESTSTEVSVDLNDFHAYKLGVSRQHVRVEQKEGLVYITDLGSTNGTFLNNSMIASHTEQLVQNGDVIRLGQLEIHIEF
jgi:DNA-binding response OmpR family regulator